MFLNKIEQGVVNELLNLEREIYQIRKAEIENKVVEIAASKLNLSSQQYLNKAVFSKTNVSEQEIIAFYNERKDEISANFEDIKPRIVRYLKRKLDKEAYAVHVDQLFAEYDVHLKIPLPRYLSVKDNKYQQYSKGDKDAPIKIIEFADLQCGHCKDAYIALKSLMKTYPNKIQFTFRHFPLPFNKHSKVFAKAATCAGNQK